MQNFKDLPLFWEARITLFDNWSCLHCDSLRIATHPVAIWLHELSGDRGYVYLNGHENLHSGLLPLQLEGWTEHWSLGKHQHETQLPLHIPGVQHHPLPLERLRLFELRISENCSALLSPFSSSFSWSKCEEVWANLYLPGKKRSRHPKRKNSLVMVAGLHSCSRLTMCQKHLCDANIMSYVVLKCGKRVHSSNSMEQLSQSAPWSFLK